MKYTKLVLVAFIVFSCSKEKPPVGEPKTPKVSYVTWKSTCYLGYSGGTERTRVTFQTHDIAPRARVEARYVDQGTVLDWIRLVRENDDVIWNVSERCTTTAKLFLVINDVVQDSTRVTCQACD